MAKKRDLITRFTLKHDENGVWYAHDNWYPYIGHPDSWGSKERAQNYIAGDLGISWKEYQSIKNGKSMRKEAAPMTTQEKALSFLYGELRKAKIALGRAEGKPNSREEQENLQTKIDAIDWILEKYFEGEKNEVD